MHAHVFVAFSSSSETLSTNVNMYLTYYDYKLLNVIYVGLYIMTVGLYV